MKRCLYVLLTALLSINISFAQIRLSSINVDDWVKKNFSGQGVVIGNVRHTGYPLSTLSYTSTGNVLQVQKGLILSTGNSFNVAGFNNSHNQSSTFGDIGSPQKDPDLSAIIKENLYDICSIEFDFVPLDNSIQFNYQFGSDEYPEYVGTAYNDIFAFIVSDENSAKNIALVPGTTVPVSINTINFKTNAEHFIDNNPFTQVLIKRQQPIKSTYHRTFPGRVWQGIKIFFTASDIEEGDRLVIQPDPNLLKTIDANLYRNLRYDGITKKLVAQAYVVPYKKYHLKIVIADASDNIYDSGVFIEDRSLTSKKDVLQPSFTDYPDLSKVIDPNLILQGKTLEEILPDQFKKTPEKIVEQVRVTTAQPKKAPSQPKKTAVQLVKDVPQAEKEEIQNAVIYFDFDQSDISVPEMTKLKEVIRRYEQIRKRYTFRISGHTDSIGSLKYNMDLSKRRNQAVVDSINYILSEKIKVGSVNKAFTEPVADNSTDSGRQSNRRVEIVFIKRE